MAEAFPTVLPAAVKCAFFVLGGRLKLAQSIFEGVKILAVTRQIAAPFSTYHMALHGADVLVVENPKEPDSMRLVAGSGGKLGKMAMSHSFMAQGANKKNMTLNLAVPEGQAIFRKLAAQADIVVENLVAGTMRRYGLSYEELSRDRPDLIYCSITGYGQSGPTYKRAAIDGAVQAASGLMSMTGTQETGPMKVGFLMADYATGYAAALAMVSALFHRSRTGEGQYIDTAMLDTAITMAGADVCEAATTGVYKQLRGNGDGRYVSNVFRCKEGRLSIAATTPSRRARLWKAIGREDIPLDPRFSTNEAAAANYPAMAAEIEKTLAGKTALEWEEIISDAGVAAMAVRDLYQAADNPQIRHRDLLHRFPMDPELGYEVVVPKAPYHFSKTPARVHSPPARYGQHTEEVLLGLGFTGEQVAKMRTDGVI